MKKVFSLILAMTVMMIAGCGSEDPKALAGQVDELLAKNFPMTEEQKAGVMKFTEQANDLLGQGKSEESIQAYNQALAILKEAEDADLFNKSE